MTEANRITFVCYMVARSMSVGGTSEKANGQASAI